MTTRRQIIELKHAIRDAKDIAREQEYMDRELGEPIVYFVQAAGQLESPIKIGFTTEGNLEDRLISLQTGNPYRLRILATMLGGQQAEKRLHKSFEHAHVLGEWFDPTPALLALIDGLPNCVRLDKPIVGRVA
jgi:hypothetical protein